MGNDYYISNEHLVTADREELIPSGEVFGYYVITKQYFDRYHLPVMHTETNQRADIHDACQWLWKEWANTLRLKEDGVPIIGFTWYSLIDQIDWDTALREDNGRLTPVGLYDLDRNVRPVGQAYRRLVSAWRHITPVESRCLMTM
jgi:beta-glucosidase/6-phospho-beta-glucosidase/beta-galactosidase